VSLFLPLSCLPNNACCDHGERENYSPVEPRPDRAEHNTRSFLPNLCLDLVGLVALADLSTVLERTALAGKAAWYDALILCPGMHRQQLATELNNGEYPATAALTTGYVFRIENQATVYFLQKVGKTGHLTTLSVQDASRSQDYSFREFPGTCRAIALLTLMSVGALFMVDLWAIAIIGMLMTARLLNILVIQARSSGLGWKGIREPRVHGDLLILLSQDRWIRIQGLVDDLKAVTSGHWLRDASFGENMTTSAATFLVYLAAALTTNASRVGQMVLLLLLGVSFVLLSLCNHSVDLLLMNGFVVRRQGRPKAYKRRLDLANQLIEESGRDDWAIRMGMIVPNPGVNAKNQNVAEHEVTM
jgi:hypothetical protein